MTSSASPQAAVKAGPPPHSRESEMMVLGCMLSNQYALRIAASGLESTDFYFHEHQLVFHAIKRLYREGKPSEIHLAAEELKRSGYLQTIGGVAYLAQLAQFAGTSANIHEYISILKSKSFSRQAFHLLEEGKREFLSDPSDPNDLAEKYHAKLIALGKRYQSAERASIGDVLSGSKSRIDPIPMIERIEERHHYFKLHRKPFMTGVPTGFVELDREATILEESNLIVIAARPAMGKTAFAINIANHVCIDQQKSVAIFSLEMGADQLAERFLSLRTGIAGEKIKRGMLSDRELQRLREEEEILRSAKLYLCDQNCSTISQLVARARRLKEEDDVSLFVVDYIQLLQGAGGKSESRQYEVAEISRKLKMLAMELKTPFICISQLSRKVEERQGHRPMMSDLRDSGQIEQDSDVVLFIQRREYYDPQDKPGMAELIVAKNRNGGSTPNLNLVFDGKCGRFSSPVNEYKEPQRDEGVLAAPRPYLTERRFAQTASHPLLR